MKNRTYRGLCSSKFFTHTVLDTLAGDGDEMDAVEPEEEEDSDDDDDPEEADDEESSFDEKHFYKQVLKTQ